MATTFAVPDGRVAMAATLYTGNGTGVGQSITNTVNTVSFQPDLVWIKSRSGAYDHGLVDSNRGAGKFLFPNLTIAEGNYPTDFASFNSNGFTLGTGTGVVTNNSGSTYVGWQWKAGAAAVSNTAGTITSSVSANTTAGFSISTFTTPTSGAFTFGHGLGVKPAFFIVKTKDTAGWNWSCWHQSLSSDTTSVLILNSTAAVSNAFNIWGASGSNTTVIGVTAANAVAASSACVAYCWAPVAGYSAFGSYTGNGSADGPFIYTGFRPRWLMIKRTDYVAGYGDWYIWDSARNIYNSTNSPLSPDTSAIENANNSSLAFDMVSNGFKLRSLYQDINNSGTTYIYAAFAENPLKYSNAR